jgi:hypothetical protein
MKDVKINISSAGFPNQFVSDAEKQPINMDYKSVKPFSMSGLEKMEANVDFTISLQTLIG